MKKYLLFIFFVVSCFFVTSSLANYLQNRPVEIKLGYPPSPQIVKAISGEHAITYASISVMRVLFYYGTILQKVQENVIIQPEFRNMYRTLERVVYIDPYNMDAYYFAQAAFTWELGRIDEVNSLLEKGLRYRTWDYWIPFYMGFNYAYFKKDYVNAARYMSRAAEISHNPLFAKLASRYFYESEQSELGFAFLDTMIAQSKSDSIRQSYQLRRDALTAVSRIEKAMNQYRKRYSNYPEDIDVLLQEGYLSDIPQDPYGGTFFLDDGRVKTTSKFVLKDD